VTLRSAIWKVAPFWRRSIQARVVVSTMVLTAVAVTVVGWLLLMQTRDGLLEHRVDTVVAEVADEVADTQARLASASGIDVDASGQRADLVTPIIQRGQSRDFWVVMAGPLVGSTGRISDGGTQWTPGLDTGSVPSSLEAHFQAPNPDPAWTYTEIRYEDASAGDGVREVPGVVVGTQVTLPADGSVYTLYFLYPLTPEQETLDLVSRGLLVAGGVLILAGGLVAWVVVRQVVTPVRLARRVAERIAAGKLQERMQVSGEDDLARLAESFNQMAANLQNQIRQLEELSRVQRRFTSDVSHELRTPLTTVRMAGDVIHDSRDQFDPATARAAELLQTELDRFETLLTDLLEISRFDAGAAVLSTEDVDLVEIAERAAENQLPLAERRGVRLQLRTPGRPCYAEADRRRIERIVRNLVANAIDHAGGPDEAAESIDIYVDSDDHAAAIAVRDHGVGLAPGETAMVFNRFWRADPARARTSGGTGLGLSISLEDARLHGGWLQAWGRPDQGAQFRLTLPRRAGGTLRHSPLPLVPPDADAPPQPPPLTGPPARSEEVRR